MPTKIKIILITGLVLTGLFFGGIIGLVYFGFQKIQNTMFENLTPEEKIEMERFFKEPIEIPVSWQIKKPLSEDYQKEMDSFIKTYWIKEGFFSHWNEFEEKHYSWNYENLDLTDEVKNLLDEYSQYRKDFIHLVKNPEFSLYALSRENSKIDPDSETNFYYCRDKLFVFLDMLKFQNKSLQSEGKNPDMETLFFFFELLKTPPGAGTDTFDFTSQAARQGADSLYSSLPNLANLEDLKSFFKRMGELAPISEPHYNKQDDLPGYFILLDCIAYLRDSTDETMKIDFSQKRPGAYYLRLKSSAEFGELEGAPPVHKVPGLSDTILKTVYVSYNYMKRYYLKELNNEKLFFDLAYLSLGKRILELEGKEISEDSISLLFGTQLPEDPYSQKPYLFDPDEGLFYSVGPDKVSNNNQVIYDPTNGINSSGDINIKVSSVTSWDSY